MAAVVFTGDAVEGLDVDRVECAGDDSSSAPQATQLGIVSSPGDQTRCLYCNESTLDSFVLSPVPALGYGNLRITMQWIPMHRILLHSIALVLIEMDTNGMLLSIRCPNRRRQGFGRGTARDRAPQQTGWRSIHRQVLLCDPPGAAKWVCNGRLPTSVRRATIPGAYYRVMWDPTSVVGQCSAAAVSSLSRHSPPDKAMVYWTRR